MKVSDAMTKQLVCCLKSDTAQSVVALMKRHDIGSVPVVADLVSKTLEGIVTDRDICVRLIAESRDPVTTHIAALMTPNPVTCAPSSLVVLLSSRCLINSGSAKGPRRTNSLICGGTLGGAMPSTPP
jgi:CBS domain-containing protein